MKTSDFDYHLPEELIATHPPKIRGSSRLLIIDRQKKSLVHRNYADLPELLNPGDLLILNDTKVFKARLKGVKQNGRDIELLLLEKHSQLENPYQARAIRYGKARVGDRITVGSFQIEVTRKDKLDGTLDVKSDAPFSQIIAQSGKMPLPPYLNRTATKEDEIRYQTVMADQSGSVASPTAALNFTPELHQRLLKNQIQVETLTLHIGQGTFQPIWEENLKNHTMHQEFFMIPKQTVQAIQKTKHLGKKIVALGTTVTRALEFSAEEIINGSDSISGEADIFMYPGYEFKLVDSLLTNFHAPKSTVLMMAAAFTGKELLQKSYQEAIEHKYQFLSYGDSMLII